MLAHTRHFSCPTYPDGALRSIDTVAQISGDSVLCIYDNGAHCSYDSADGDLLNHVKNAVQCTPENGRDVALRSVRGNGAAAGVQLPKRSIANLQQQAKALRAKMAKKEKKRA